MESYVQSGPPHIYAELTEIETNQEGNYSRWYADERLPRLLELPQVASGAQYGVIVGLETRQNVVVTDRPQHLAIYELTSPAMRCDGSVLEQPSGFDLQARRQGTILEQIFPPSGVYQGAAWDTDQTPVGAVLATRADVAPEWEAEHNEFHNQEHMPMVCRVPGVIWGRRFKTLAGSPRYWTFYGVTDHRIRETRAWDAARSTPWTRRMAPHSSFIWRAWYRPLS